MRLMNKRSWLEIKIEQVLEFTGIVLVVAISVLTLIQVFLRYIAKVPFMWSEEFIRFLFIWMVWLGAVLATPRGTHMVIEYFRDALFLKKALVIKFIMQIFALGLMVVMVVKGWFLAQSLSMEYHTTFPISVKYKYLASAVCGGLMFYYLCLQSWVIWKELRAGNKKH